jgi:RNA processing factor Prp31
MHGELILIERLEAENSALLQELEEAKKGYRVAELGWQVECSNLKQMNTELRQNLNRTDLQVQQLVELVDFYKEKFKRAEALLEELQRRYEPELEYARDLGRCGI